MAFAMLVPLRGSASTLSTLKPCGARIAAVTSRSSDSDHATHAERLLRSSSQLRRCWSAVPGMRPALRRRLSCTSSALPAAALAHLTAAVLAPTATLGAASNEVAATLAPLAPQVDPVTRDYLITMGIGSAAVVATLLFTSRFILSYFPGLEKKAKAAGRPSMLKLVTMLDGALDPVSKGWFKQTEAGDLHYGAFLFLALTSAALEVCVGEGGLLLHVVPSLDQLVMLRELLIFQHGILLPCWAMVVFRAYRLI